MSFKIDDKKYLVKTSLGNYVERGNTGLSTDEFICYIPDGTTTVTCENGCYFFWNTTTGESFDAGEWVKTGEPSGLRHLEDYIQDRNVNIIWERKCVDEQLKESSNKFLGETSSSTPLKGYSESKPDLQYAPFNPLDVQEGGGHYKGRGIQPVEYTQANNLNFQQGNVVKYITRHKEKNGVEDLAKVVHYALLEAYFVYGVEGSSELKDRILKMLGES